MSEAKSVIEELFNVIEDEQKIKAGSCKTVCSLEPGKRALLEAQITARLQQLLDQEPTHALLVCQRCEGCPALRRVLRGPCWAILLRVCLEHLGTQEDGQPWPPHHLPRAVRVLYIVLKEQPSQDHHQDCHQNIQQMNQHLTRQHQLDSQQQEHINDLQYETAGLRPLLEAARVTLTLALLDGGPLASGSHALVASTTLCLLLQYLEQKGSIIAFLDTVWILNHLAEKSKVMTNTINRRDTDVRYDDEEMSRMKDHFRSPEEGKGSTANITIKKSISATSSLRWEDVRTAIESARRGDEGRKLMKRNFEGMEGSYSSSTLLLQGILNAGGKLLFHENEEEEGHKGRVFLYSLHPLLLKLCSGGATQHTFQAFQALYLWIRAVRELGSRERRHTGRTRCQGLESDSSGQLEEGTVDIHVTSTITTNASTTCPIQGAPHPSKHALFSMVPGSPGPVFTLLNASWENPAKGVSELVVKCMEELLSLHEDGTKGARQQLARDMLQALLYSSSSSSATSVWTSKSTYPPLALALTHLGCQEALHLYPSLPASLVSSLGVNHLAPATTSVYKVFLAQLGVSSWSQHFLTPMSVVLSSQDRLTQQHLLSLWIPPTLKKYPGIHWALLASCSNTTPGWLSRMALLRTARSVGALELGEQGSAHERSSMEAASNSKGGEPESETEKTLIMPHIHTALRHRDENVRLEALSLLCHTQKTSQPVSHFETVCLQNFLKWNMNIDSAPFRQGVLKCVAALLVRLRGATASYWKSQNSKGVKSTVKKTAKEPTLTHNLNQKCGVVEVSHSTVLSTSGELVLWLVREAHRGMAPDANYQRRILALQLYKEVLLALLPSDTAVPHLGKRVTSSPDPLLLHLNTMTAKRSANHWNNTSDGKDKEGNPSLHSLSPELDIYGDRKALDQPLIDLTFPWTLHTLLHLCIDEMNDVRAEATEIIHIFTSQGRMALSCSEGREWMRHAMKLCDSPKASDAESGGTLALTVAHLIPEEHLNEVLEGVSGVESEGKDGGGDGGGGCESSETSTPSSRSLGEYLLARVEHQFSAAKTNLLWAARHAPIHGTLQALGQYITQRKDEEQEEVKKKAGERKMQQKKEGKKKENEVAEKAFIPAFLPYLTSLLQRLVEFVLDTLASTSPLGSAVPPSFAEMGEAVRKVVEEGKEKLKEDEEKSKNVALSPVASLLEQGKEEDEDEEEEGLLSSDHVLVLSCCWQILKGCCEVTNQLIHLLAGEPKAADDLIRVVVVRVLLGTRHKGAMEAARATYASLWSCLLQNATLRGPFGVSDSCIVDILHQQVGEVVHMLGAPRGTSVTRRAAGVAMMVQAACGAAPRLTPTLLTTTVASLTTTACSQVGMDESGTTDAPQALALHVLQSLVLHSPLAPFLRPHLTSLTSTCLHAFASPSWAIRNAALQLFGSLVSSLVGQKKVRDDTSALNSLTTPEFISRHPALVQLLLSALGGDSECHIEGSEDSKVTPGTFTQTQDTDTLPPSVKQLSKDPDKHTATSHNTEDTHHQIHTPTHMHIHIKSASILVPVLSLVARLSPGTGLQQNPHLTRTLKRFWHSTACLLESPVYNVRRLAALALVSLTPSNEALPHALQLLLKASDPIISTNLIHGHLLALSNFLQTHPNLAEESKLRESASASLTWLFSPRNNCHVNTALALKIMMVLNINILDACHIPALDSFLPGAAECRSSLTFMRLSYHPRNTIKSLFLSEAPIATDLLEVCSDAILYEIKTCHCASWLLECERCFWHHLEESFLTPKGMAAILQFLTVIMEKVESAGSCIPKQGLAVLLSCMKGLQGSSATCAALVLLAHLMRHPANITEDTLAAFAGVLSQHSHPTSSEDHRLAASAALKVAIKPIFTCHHQISLIVRKQLIASTVALLQDEDSLIRDTATSIVAALVTPSGAIQEHSPYFQPNPHPNLALFEFFSWLADKSMMDNDWTILRILWEVCSGEEGSKSFLSATTLTAGHLRLFQSHAANLYHEPRQVSISVGVALMKTIEEHRQASVWESQQQNTSWNKHQPGKDYKSQENTNIGQEDSNPSQFSVRDWLEKERAKLNCQGEALFSMAPNHNFWHHRRLAFEAGVYVVSCKVFKLLCEVFSVSPELAYYLVWSEKGYGTVDEIG